MEKTSSLARKNANVEVPDIVIGRLPIYLRTLALLQVEDQEVTSSQELGRLLNISSAQIRKDLSHFGEFGKQGTGYKIAYLKEQLEEILNLKKNWPVALVGLGDLGSAIVHYNGFPQKGFHIQAIFDNDPQKVGLVVNNIPVQDSSELQATIESGGFKIAILAVPLQSAQKIADILVQAGIKAILNYAPITLSVPADVQVQNLDPVGHLQQMTYYLK